MEFADGGDLDEFIKKTKQRRSNIPEKKVISLFVQISLAIKHFHDRKVLHRDLKSQVRTISLSFSSLSWKFDDLESNFDYK